MYHVEFIDIAKSDEAFAYCDYADEHTDAEILDYLKTCFCSCRPGIEWCF